MRKNKISKIAFLTGLLIINTNTKGFYQCVPKQDWFKKQFDLNIYSRNLKMAEIHITDDRYWDLVSDNEISGTLDSGIFRVVVAGGAGGKGGDTVNRYTENGKKFEKYNRGGNGGAGDKIFRVFGLKDRQEFNACIGSAGENGFYSNVFMGAPGGGGGGGSAFKIGNLEIFAAGGGGGGGGSYPRNIVWGGGSYQGGGGGGGGGGYGCKTGGDGGAGDCSREFGIDNCHPGKGGKVLKGTWDKGNSGHNGAEDSGSTGGKGGDGGNTYIWWGFGKKSCNKGGAGGTEYSEGENGSSCTSDYYNYGDGYVKIYKYKF